MTIDNFDKILSILNFDLGSYHVQVLQRKKDGNVVSNNNQSRTIVEWIVYTEEKLLFLKPAIKNICQEYNARCYVTINPKSSEAVLWKMLENITMRLKNKQYFPSAILPHCHDTVHGVASTKKWIVDVDNPEVDINELCNNIEQCRSGHVQRVITIIPSKTGTHIITHPFDLTQIELPAEVEIKKNNSTLLFCI